MGYDYFNHAKFLQHKVRNMTRRGWLLKTYNDGKLLTARVKLGAKQENDDIDILQPVGLNAHVKPSDKVEVFSMDVGADTSQRVITHIIGNREDHPQPDENEAYLYAPGDKKIYQRMKKKKEDGGQEGGEEGGEGKPKGVQQRRTIDREHEPGSHTDAKDQRATLKTESSIGTQGDKGIGFASKDGNYTIDAGKNTQFTAGGKHVRKGETVRDGQMFVQGNVHATDHIAGGGAQVQSRAAVGYYEKMGIRAMRNASGQDDREPERPKEDGTQEWQAQGRPGNTSLLQTAAKVGTMGGMMGSLTGMMGMLSGMMQQGGGGTQQQQEDLQRKVQELEDQLQQLQSIPDLPP